MSDSRDRWSSDNDQLSTGHASSYRRFLRASGFLAVGVALPLLNNPTSCTSVVKSATLADLHKSYPQDVPDKEKSKSKLNKAPGSKDSEVKQSPFLTATDGRALSTSELLERLSGDASKDNESAFELQFRIRTAALKTIAAEVHELGTDQSKTHTQRQPSQEESVIATLLLKCIDELSANADSRSKFLHILDSVLAGQHPFSIHLSPSEEAYYSKIVQACLKICQAESQDVKTEGSDSVERYAMREKLVRFWLGYGSIQQALHAVQFLLTSSSIPEPSISTSTSTDATMHLRKGVAADELNLAGFLKVWQRTLGRMQRRILRVTRTKHLTDISSHARKLAICCSAQSSARIQQQPKKTQSGRRWDWEDDNGWEKFDEKVAGVLEAAYQAGKQYVDFNVEGRPEMWRADLNRMVQRDLATNKERNIRSLLSLQIKEKGGRLSQTVEITMSHNTVVRDLRKELATYLGHDESLLRMMYGNRVLRRADYQNLTIRESIVPLGSEPLVVCKMNKGDLEDLCAFVVTGPSPFLSLCTNVSPAAFKAPITCAWSV